jgi:hypothetical protein
MITHRPVLKGAVFVMVLVRRGAAPCGSSGRTQQSSPTDLVVMTVLTVVPMVAALYLALWHSSIRCDPTFHRRAAPTGRHRAAATTQQP